MSADACTVTLSSASRSTCRAHFGRKSGCDKCPLRTPCLELGRAPARSFEELDAARLAFNLATDAILAVR